MATPYTPRQQMAFPEVATIRKGTPKVEMKKANGEKFFGLGSDLKGKFRIAFIPGAESAKEFYKALHPDQYVKYDLTYRRPGVYAEPDGFEAERIYARVPCLNVFDAFTWANEANNGGAKIAECDDTHYIMEKNPLNTRQYYISNGQPYKEFHHGDTITYEKNGRTMIIPFKSTLRMNLFLPEMERFVYFTLKSTSIYDRWNIEAQLSGIQFWANTLNNGSAAGIPMIIYRREQEVTWNKPDGSAQRTKQWLINVEADPEWVKSAISRMGNMALGMDIQKMLAAPPVVELAGAYNPEAPDDEGAGSEDLGDQPESSEPPIVTDAEAKPAKREWTADQQKCLIDAQFAKNEFNALGMLDLSILPGDATEAEILRWGRLYRSFRDEKSADGKNIRNTAQAAEAANDAWTV